MTESLINPRNLYSEIAKILKGRAVSANGNPVVIRPTLNILLNAEPFKGFLNSEASTPSMIEDRKCQNAVIHDALYLERMFTQEYPADPTKDYDTKLMLMRKFPEFIHVPSFKDSTRLHVHASSWSSNMSYWAQARGPMRVTEEELITQAHNDLDSIMGDIFRFNATQEFDPDELLENDPDLSNLKQNFLTNFVNYVTEETYVEDKFDLIPEFLESAINANNPEATERIYEQSPMISTNLRGKWAVSTEFDSFSEFLDSLTDLEPSSSVRLTLLKPSPIIDGISGYPFITAESATGFVDDDGVRSTTATIDSYLITLPTVNKASGMQ